MTVSAPAGMRTRDKLVAGFLLLLLGIGSLALWTAVPVGVLWGASQLTETSSSHLVLTIIGAPLAMVLFAQLLLWVNRLYLRVTLPFTHFPDDEIPRIRGPLEPMVLASMPVAIVGFVVFLILFADKLQISYG